MTPKAGATPLSVFLFYERLEEADHDGCGPGGNVIAFPIRVAAEEGGRLPPGDGVDVRFPEDLCVKNCVENVGGDGQNVGVQPVKT